MSRLSEPRTVTPDSAFGRLLAGSPAALARALSVLENGGDDADLLAARVRPYTGRALVVGFTGPPGAGKSTLISAYVTALRAAGERVAVLAVDPSSPLSGGALLGDRLRMGEHLRDPGVFIRSVASKCHLGGLALSVPALLDATDAAGWPTIVVETVGAGQSETEIVEFADVKIVLSAPGLGDDVQALKAGVLEIADILVINKCDLPFAAQLRRQVEGALRLRPSDRAAPPVVSTSASADLGIDDLVAEIDVLRGKVAAMAPDARLARRLRGAIIRSAEAEFRDRIARLGPEAIDTVCTQVSRGEASVRDVAGALVDACASNGG